jgi:hypothetical protein
VDLSLPSILNNVAGGHEKFAREQDEAQAES